MIAILSLSAGLAATVWARPLMQLLTTDAYLSTIDMPGSDTALALLGPSMILNGVVLFCFYSLLSLGKAKRLTWTLAFAAALSQALNVALIPRLGFVGAATTSICVHATIASLLFIPTLRHLRIGVRSLEWGRIAAYAVLLAIALLALKPLLTVEWATGLGILALGILAAIFVEMLGIRRIVTQG
jgi:O-antigen/teichoic acid export membrane protein